MKINIYKYTNQVTITMNAPRKNSEGEKTNKIRHKCFSAESELAISYMIPMFFSAYCIIYPLIPLYKEISGIFFAETIKIPSAIKINNNVFLRKPGHRSLVKRHQFGFNYCFFLLLMHD